MAQCPACGECTAAETRFCPRCGTSLRPASPHDEQLRLPGLGWIGPGPMALQPAGGAAAEALAAPAPARALSFKQVALAAGIILLALAGFLYVTAQRNGGDAPPLLGMLHEPIVIGNTALGVAFVESPRRVDNHVPRGRFLAVGVVIGNRGRAAFTLDSAAFALLDGAHRDRIRPRLVAYGSPEELNAGHYRERFPLAPGEMTAGIILFDIPTTYTQPRLLVRDLSQSDSSYTGMVDLTRQADSGEASRWNLTRNRVAP